MSLRDVSCAYFALSIGLAVILPRTAAAQTSPRQNVPLPGGPASGAVVFDQPQKQTLETAEDIEIFRHILHDELQSPYQRITQVIGMPYNMDMASSMGMMPGGMVERPVVVEVEKPLAVYLPHHGVVYQLTVPPPAPEAEPAKPGDAAKQKPLSRWEKMHRRLLGQKAPERRSGDPSGSVGEPLGGSGSGYSGVGGPMSALGEVGARMSGLVENPERVQAGRTRTQLVEALLDILAENGRHFRHLAKDDHLTVAITFRRPEPQPRTASPGMPGTEAMGEDYGTSGEMMSRYGSAGGYGGAYGGAAGSAGDDAGGYNPGIGAGVVTKYPAKYRAGAVPGASQNRPGGNLELQGDLHLRQGDYQKAIEAYEKALIDAGLTVAHLHTVDLGGGASQIELSVDESGSEGDTGMTITMPHRPLKPDEQRLIRKYIQAQVGAGNLATAQHVLTALKEADAKSAKSAGAGTGDAAAAETPKHIPLPARLIVSVTKADCDAVAVGKISRDQFRQNAAVHFDNPAALQEPNRRSEKDPFGNQFKP